MLSEHNEKLSSLQSNLQFRQWADAPNIQRSKRSEHSWSINESRWLWALWKQHLTRNVNVKTSLLSTVMKISKCKHNNHLITGYCYPTGENNNCNIAMGTNGNRLMNFQFHTFSFIQVDTCMKWSSGDYKVVTANPIGFYIICGSVDWNAFLVMTIWTPLSSCGTNNLLHNHKSSCSSSQHY